MLESSLLIIVAVLGIIMNIDESPTFFDFQAGGAVSGGDGGAALTN